MNLEKFETNKIDLSSSRFVMGGMTEPKASKCTRPTDGSCEDKQDDDNGKPIENQLVAISL
ncbi:hypothetical protein [uncultured Tenacibaculum sp.]|uniref:hypothetical protein n=1 Tax=uncultured Tenacibaculum sp. TaxID=174713 RepID=UPI00262C62BA|nr:hypothetical protein [uncultured Tenacibaculum sp.]